jgi:DNA-directed RNA polymerase specialized sigma24 family protein
MNLASDPRQPQPSLERALEDDDVREIVSSTVRRAVPAMDADDVAQGVFCDALRTHTLPSNPLEIPFWLAGIARHHVANYFRRRPREVLGLTPDVPTAPATFESREALGHVFARIGDDADAKRTLKWMVLEHEGVPLKSIAHAEKLSPAAVRARVYRLRGRLRRELGYLLTVLLLCFGVGAVLRERGHAESAATGDRADSNSTWTEGDFEITRMTPASDVDPVARVRIESLLRGATVSVRGHALEVRTPTQWAIRSLSFARDESGESLSVALTDETGRVQPVSVRRAGETLLVESTSGAFRGTLVLKRLQPRRERNVGK